MRELAYETRTTRSSFIEYETEEYGVPATRKAVCPSCRGHGKYVNPFVDGNGISAEEFYQDPEFAEAYFSGVYDVVCEECQGTNVVDEFVDPEVEDRWQEWMSDMYEDAAIRRAESGYY